MTSIPTIFIEANLFQDETLLTSDSGTPIMRLQAAVPKSFPLQFEKNSASSLAKRSCKATRRSKGRICWRC